MNSGAGKGDSPRPVNGDRFRENFDRIFNKSNAAKRPETHENTRKRPRKDR